MAGDFWEVRLSAAAKQDYRQILRWSVAKFGAAQAQIYADTVSSVLKDLAAGPDIIGVKACDDIGVNIKMVHVARKGQKGRHFVLFRAGCFQGRNTIEVLRLLHDSMDLARHLS
jgi:toxin ParE1/3/4